MPGESALPPAKLTLPAIADMRARGDRLVMVTAYDMPSAKLADAAGIDLVLVGDSAGDTVLGYPSTVPVTMDEMLIFTRAVARGVHRALVVADMPFGSYQVSEDVAIANAIRLVKEGGADAVKLEGAGRTLTRISGIVDAGIPVMGHVGLTPQSAGMLGGYRAQGRTAAAATRIVEEAMALERAGCFALVLEAIPAVVAERITERLRIPTIGIGAGPSCSGQVLVWHDLVGLSTRRPSPKFVKQYAAVGEAIGEALRAYASDVRAGTFPEERHTYSMPDAERERFDAPPLAKPRG
ncbi:MAG: 3-methyl-2-oxobutanoate hydroxymethyltransferase [Acidobacteria bacterium]|nr:3-methyl-2-oxobutanoate hydroxymethyltransferase [Acidobacteriota bacterium]